MLAGLGSGVGLVAVPALARPAPLDIAPYRTPYKLERLIVTRSDDPEAFDSKFVDAPLVIRGPDRFYMCYYGFDGVGYQTGRSEEHTSELQSLMRISYAVFCLQTKKHPF